MALTLKGGPKEFSPAFNEVDYYFDSTNKNKEGFRYVVDLYRVEAGVAVEKVYETRCAPAHITGYGEVFLRSILSKKLSYDLDLTEENGKALNSQFIFKLQMGEEYVAEWSFDEYGEQTTGDFAGYTKLYQTPTLTTHTFVKGDQINVKQSDGGAEKPMLEGLFTVVDVPNSYTVVIDVLWSVVGTGDQVGGNIRYASNRKVITRNMIEEDGAVFNGAVKFKDFPAWEPEPYYIIQDTEAKPVSSMPEDFRITPTQDVFVNWCNFYEGGPGIFIVYENDAGDKFRKEIECDPDTVLFQTMVAGDGMGLGTTVAGTTPLIKEDTAYYEFWLEDESFTRISKKVTLSIDHRCKIEDIEIIFLDRMGSFPSFAFQLRAEQRGEVSREKFKQYIGGLNEDYGGYTYKVSDRGTTISSVSEDETYVIRTNWMPLSMGQYFKELVTSPVTLIKLDGVYQACEILDTSFEVPRDKTKKLIRKTITVKLCNQNNINV